MSFNQAKIVNVYYKADRKPYDVNGKPVTYLGDDYIGANESVKIRFRFVPDIVTAGWTALTHVKRADGETRFEILSASSDTQGNYFELVFNGWFSEKPGKLVIGLKIYDGEPTYGLTEGVPTSIESVDDLTIIASDIFNATIGYSPNATDAVPAFDDTEFLQLLAALSEKPDFGQTIYVVPSLPTLTGGVFDNQWFLVKSGDGNIGKLYHIDGSTAEEVELGLETLKMTATGNGNLTTNTGKIAWQEATGTATLGLYDSVNLEVGQQLLYYSKASGAIAKGDIVQFAGIQGDHYLVKKAVQSEVNANPELIMGIAAQDLTNNNFGYITAFGRVDSVDTKGQVVGSYVWFDSSGSTAGAWTTTKPSAPNAKILVGVIVKAETSGPANNGVILVRPTFEPRIGDLQDVSAGSPTNGDILRYNSSTGVWAKNTDLSTAETEIDTLQSEMNAVEGRLDIVEPIVAQHTVDISDLDDRIEQIEDTGGIDFVKVADYASLPSTGTAREHQLFLTEDTKQLWEWDGSAWNESSPTDLSTITVTGDSGTVALTVTGDATGLQNIVNVKDKDDNIAVAVSATGALNAYGDLTVSGNLTVNGTTTTVNTATLDVEDNIITINKNQTGTPESTLLSGIEVERGDETNYQFAFQESTDLFKIGQVGNLQAVATREDTPTDKGVPFFNASTNKFETSSNLKVNASGQLEDVTIRNSATTTNPLVIDALTSSTANMIQFKVNGQNTAAIKQFGILSMNQLENTTSSNNSVIVMDTTGTLIQRTIADSNVALKVNQNSSSSTGNIANFQFAGANKAVITYDGKVGIGTSAPATIFNIVSGSNADGIQIRRNSNTAEEYGLLSFRIATSESAVNYAEIRAVRTDRAVTQDTDLRLFTRSNSAVGERMRIRDDGLVGINETSPTAQLQVKSGVTTRVPLIVDTLASQTANLTEWRVDGGTQARITNNGRLHTAGIFQVNNGDNGNVQLFSSGVVVARNVNDTNPALIVNQTNSSSTGDILRLQKAGSSQVVVTHDGKVGIGNTNPQTKLHVNGIIRSEGTTGASSPELSLLSAGYWTWKIRGDGNDLKFSNDDTVRMTVNSDGNVGIGTTSPSAKLHIAGATGSWGAGIQIEGTGTNARKYGAYVTSSGHLTFTDENAAADRLTINSTGNVGIGTTSPGVKLEVAGEIKAYDVSARSSANTAKRVVINFNNTTDAGYIESIHDGTAYKKLYINPSGSEVYVGGTTDNGAYNLQVNGTGVWGAGAYVNGSDIRLKEQVKPLEDGLSVVEQLKPVTYLYKETYSKDRNRQVGFIAQDLLEALKNKDYLNGIVREGKETYSVAYQEIIPLLVKAVQELSAEVKALKGVKPVVEEPTND